MTSAQWEGLAAGAGSPEELFDPVAFEARLAAARLRRMAALAERSARRDARPPAPADASAPPPHRPAAPGGAARALPVLAGGLALALAFVAAGLHLGGAGTGPRAGAVTPLPAPALTPVPPPAAPALLPVPPPAAIAPEPDVLRPLPRPPAAQASPRRAAGAGVRVSRSTRGPERATTPPQAVRMLARDLNAATIGRTAAALGVRERVAIPGLPLSVTLDRRGFRLHGQTARRR
jgi:hypothetical protein